MPRVWLSFFFFLLLFLPTQLGRHFWPNFSIVSGIRVDYLSPTMYLTDILLILTLVMWGSTHLKISNLKSKISNLLVQYWILVVLVLIGSIGIYFSKNPLSGLYGMIKVLEYLLFAFFVAKAADLKKNWQSITTVFAIGIAFESFLAIYQFIQQSSLGGVFWFLGERTFTGQTPGIANIVLDGQLILRPYGTFSHPNVLAGYLTIALAMVISNFKFQISNFQKMFHLLIIVFGTVALFLTMSRVAIVLWLLTILLWLWKKFAATKTFLVVTLICFAIISGIFLATPLGDRFAEPHLFDESIVRRRELSDAALAMIRDHPLVGVGLNNFIVNLPFYQRTESTVLYLQPTHNIYLLIAAETGLIGLAIFLWLIGYTIKHLWQSKQFSILSIVLILGLFDHYLLTLQQGQLLFSLILGLCWNKVMVTKRP